MRSVWNVESPLLLYYSAVIASALYGGSAQGFLAAVLAMTAASTFFVVDWANLPLRFSLFALDSTFVILLCTALQRARRRAENLLKREREVHAELLQSNLRQRYIFDSQMIGLMFGRIDGTVIDCNEYLLNLLGFTREEFRQGVFNWRTRTAPEHLKINDRVTSELLAHGRAGPYEKDYLRKDGSRVPVMIGVNRIEEDSYVAFVLDMTASRRAEKALANSHSQLEERVTERTQDLQEAAMRLQQSEQFLDSVIENVPNMLFVKEAKDLRFIRFNRAGEDILGYPRDELLGKNDFDFFPREEAEFFRAKDRAVLEGRNVVDIPEEPLSTRSGLRYLHTKKIPVFDENGKAIYLLGISEDITEKKTAEQQRLRLMQEKVARAEAEKAAAQLRFLADASAALNESLDLKSMLDAFTKTIIAHMGDWCEIVLIDEAELEVRDVIVAHHDPKMVERASRFRADHSVNWNMQGGVGMVIRTGKPVLYPVITQEMIDHTVSDPERHAWLTSLGIHSAVITPLTSYGRVIGALSITSTESARSYNPVDLDVCMDLSRRASFAIENSRLFTKAQEASQAKSAFLANMSHEIRTPLGAMLGFAELLSGEKLDLEPRRYLETLLRNGQQLIRIVDEILDLSKVESDRIHIESMDFSLPDLIGEVAALLRLQAEAKDLHLYVNSLDDLPEHIRSDPTRLRQILINVIGNAIKFTAQGDIDVHVEIHPRAAHPYKPILEISVSDTGIGISQDQRDKLFQPFVQADNSMTRRFGGTGLGLFLARRLARLMGGDVVLGSSQPNSGSQFIITVAVDTLDGGERQEPPPKVIPLRPDLAAAKGQVLIVDDAADNRLLMQVYVSRLGLTTETAATGAEAVEKAMSRQFQVILMDVQMPEMDGFEAVHELRSRGYHGPIVALTAHTMKGDRERCLEGGFDDYLGKPIDRELLKACLSRLLPRPLEL